MGEWSGKPPPAQVPAKVRFNLRPLVVLVAAALVLVALLTLLGFVISGPLEEPVASSFDRRVARLIVQQRVAWATDLLRAATHLGGTIFVAVALVAAAALSYLRSRALTWPSFFAATAVGGLQLAGIVKALVDRARPELSPLYVVDSPAFPSGHAAASAACFLALAFYMKATTSIHPAVAWITGALAAIVVGFTRVYLGVHWPTDVLFGWALGAAWVAVAARAAGLSGARTGR